MGTKKIYYTYTTKKNSCGKPASASGVEDAKTSLNHTPNHNPQTTLTKKIGTNITFTIDMHHTKHAILAKASYESPE